MRHAKVSHTSAGRWSKGQIVSEDVIRQHGFDLDGWLALTPPAVELVVDPAGPPPAGKPLDQPAKALPPQQPAAKPLTPPQPQAEPAGDANPGK